MKATLIAAVLSLFVVIPPSAIAKDIKSEILPATQQQVKKINLNTADVQRLTQSFKGIGKKRAQAIVSYRQAHGEFKSIEQLAEVRGLGKAFVNAHLAQLQAVFVIG